MSTKQSTSNITCPKFAEGCLWNGHPEFQKTHIENCEYCAVTRIDLSQQRVHEGWLGQVDLPKCKRQFSVICILGIVEEFFVWNKLNVGKKKAM